MSLGTATSIYTLKNRNDTLYVVIRDIMLGMINGRNAENSLIELNNYIFLTAYQNDERKLIEIEKISYALDAIITNEEQAANYTQIIKSDFLSVMNGINSTVILADYRRKIFAQLIDGVFTSNVPSGIKDHLTKLLIRDPDIYRSINQQNDMVELSSLLKVEKIYIDNFEESWCDQMLSN